MVAFGMLELSSTMNFMPLFSVKVLTWSAVNAAWAYEAAA